MTNENLRIPIKCKAYREGSCAAKGFVNPSQPDPICQVCIDWKPIEEEFSKEELEKSITIEELNGILSTTVKHDNPTKAITFLAMLLAQTEEDQQNLIFQSESSTGKSYIPLEVAEYFPKDEVVIIASASPTAFFHEAGKWDENQKSIVIDLEKKILIFLDQPHYMLLERLRPLLSHDQKELQYKITDKSEKHGLRTKNVIIKGFPTVIFCTAKFNMDEQEKTRAWLLSPEASEEKIAESIRLLAERIGNREAFKKWLESNRERLWLKARVKAIRESGIKDVIIEDIEKVLEYFEKDKKHLIPRHQRDFPRLLGLIKAHALLNWACRERNGDKIIAEEEDIEAAFKLYSQLAKPNQYGLSPQIYEIYEKVVIPLLREKNANNNAEENRGNICGVSRKEVLKAYFKVFHRPLSEERLRREVIPSLLAAGLIVEEPDPKDKRVNLLYPTDLSPIFPEEAKPEKEELGLAEEREKVLSLIKQLKSQDDGWSYLTEVVGKAKTEGVKEPNQIIQLLIKEGLAELHPNLPDKIRLTKSG